MDRAGFTYKGYVYNPVFYSNFFQKDQEMTFNLIYQQYYRLYRLNLNVPKTYYVTDYTEKTQIYMSFGNNGLNIPTFNVGNGLSFDSALSQTSTIHLDSDINEPIFLSFNLKLTQNCAAETTIFQILNINNDVIFALICTYSSINQL